MTISGVSLGLHIFLANNLMNTSFNLRGKLLKSQLISVSCHSSLDDVARGELAD